MANNFEGAHDFQVDKLKITNVINTPPSSSGNGPLKELEHHIAAEALHDSAERCDAPKCHPETRVAVQDDLYDWIENGDVDNPNNMKWVTGPAGTGKSAIMGSLSDRCKKNGLPVASFFFSSTGSIGRRTKTAFVTTIAHQIAQHRQDLKDAIAAAIEADTIIFKKNLDVQMETLVLAPLRMIVGGPNAGLRGVIIVDGLDECEVEQIHDTTTTGSKAKPTLARTNDQDHLEILQALNQASSDPSFPFRILIASRPERVFREFFDPESNSTSFARKLDLHEDYNADADITLFLEAQFNRLRRRYNLPSSWLPPDAIKNLVDKASGQFIYAATVIRFLEMGHREPPKALIETVLKMEFMKTSNPLEHLDALYAHILESSPDSPLSVQWIISIHQLTMAGAMYTPNTGSVCTASNINLLLQKDPESSEAEHLLGNLYSLVRIPPPSNQATAKYDFYHKSLLDFLGDPGRCGTLSVATDEIDVFICDGFVRACKRGCDTHFPYPENFLKFLVYFPSYLGLSVGSACSKIFPTPASADWWVLLAIKHQGDEHLFDLFRKIHYNVRGFLNVVSESRSDTYSFSILSVLSAAGIAASRRVEFGAAPFCVVWDQLPGLHLACASRGDRVSS
ncbi:hypothetical protein EST38_g1635 [Candolleomyces aberdarensis]|uniref:Nephrocystin 3-like N-terminal domain-containing protein n=1 Tax=Candolleomyces aberdarensis TaxID=2316362 RepID=A0A4Q2DYU0_9AGAR|nr:hypothetical protein EST38_g1635 [Candolleomyces aberdarensis]